LGGWRGWGRGEVAVAERQREGRKGKSEMSRGTGREGTGAEGGVPQVVGPRDLPKPVAKTSAPLGSAAVLTPT
jgi:hypothetical protein